MGRVDIPDRAAWHPIMPSLGVVRAFVRMEAMDAQPEEIVQRYDAKVAAGQIEADPAQRRIAQRLSVLLTELENRRFATKSSALGWLFAKRDSDHPLKGIYIHGAVGRGKTMLMDLFFEAAPDLPKQRLHFHEFMADVHERIHVWRQKAKAGEVKGDDPIAPVANDIADRAKLLCFDEFQVTDITDAMILGRLFAKLFTRRVIIVATSNAEPEDLYRDGLNRALFLPFIDLLRERLDILHLDARTDFRLEKLSGTAVYFHPPDQASTRQMDGLWHKLTGGDPGSEHILRIKGRSLVVPRAAMGAARFSFAALCEQPLGAADYLKLARTYHTLFLDDVPLLPAAKRNEARRFINLIDALYDNHVKLVMSAAGEPAALYPEGDGADLFMRTASRLIEMRSAAYLAEAHGRRSSAMA